MRRATIGAALVLSFSAAFAETDYTALLDEAVAAIDWDFDAQWAYTETALHDEQLWVGRYDPRVEEDGGWRLLSVDGREPTSDEVREFLDDKEDDDESDDAEDNRVVRLVERDSLQLVEETAEHWVFSFVPDDPDDFMQSVDAKLRIAKDGRYVESITLRNLEDIRPGFGTRLTSFLTQLTFGPAVEDGPIVPKDVKVRIAGRALLVIPIDETEATQYSDYEQVLD